MKIFPLSNLVNNDSFSLKVNKSVYDACLHTCNLQTHFNYFLRLFFEKRHKKNVNIVWYLSAFTFHSHKPLLPGQDGMVGMRPGQ